jgi:hypothetical protein
MTRQALHDTQGKGRSGPRRSAWPFLGRMLSVAAAVAVTSQAMSAPPKPRKARDLVVTETMQPQLAAICQMYPADCTFNADGSVARVTGRRIAPGADRAVLRHFLTEIGAVRDLAWGNPAGETPAVAMSPSLSAAGN